LLALTGTPSINTAEARTADSRTCTSDNTDDDSSANVKPSTVIRPMRKVTLTNAVALAICAAVNPEPPQRRARTAPPVSSGNPSVWLTP
jgi:hypothetical protein